MWGPLVLPIGLCVTLSSMNKRFYQIYLSKTLLFGMLPLLLSSRRKSGAVWIMYDMLSVIAEGLNGSDLCYKS